MRVETVSTQLGEVVAAANMTTLSLNGRSYTDLLAIQPGVIPITTIQANSVIMAGVTGTIAPSGGLNAGNVSVSGQRESANGFLVNGGDVQEHMNGGTSVVPESRFDRGVPRADQQLRSAVRQLQRRDRQRRHQVGQRRLPRQRRSSSSATRRSTRRNYFSPDRAAFNQNQPGGTVGGPIKKGKIFFFADYQATRTTQGIETGLIPVPSAPAAQRQFLRRGRLADRHRQRSVLGESAVAAARVRSVTGRAVLHAGVRQRLAVRVPERDHSARALVHARAASAAVHPDAERGRRRSSRPARSRRRCATTRRRCASTATAAWACCRATTSSTTTGSTTRIPGQQGGANVPGFDALTLGRAQLFSFGANTVFGPNTVNEFHASFMRNANNVGKPNGGLGVSLASQGFVTGPGTPGIVVLAPELEGVENIVFNTFTMGVTITGVNQTNSTLNCQRRRVQGLRRAHPEVGRAVSVRPGAAPAERHVQRHVHVRRHGDRVGLRRFSARGSEQLHPVVRRHLPPAEPVRRRVCAGQLAARARS